MGFLDRFRKQPPPKPDRFPRAAAGRGHTEGFLELEETNTDLQGNAGLAVFDKMYRTDGDTRQVVAMVCNPIVSGTWEVVPYGGQEADKEAQKNAEILRWALWEQMRPNLLGHIAQMMPILVRSGFVPYEQVWMTAEFEGKTYLVPRKLDVRLPRTIWRWFQDEYGDLRSIVQQLPVPLSDLTAYPGSKSKRRAANGTDWLFPGEVEIKARDLVYYRVGAEGDNWEGVSLLRPAYKHWVMKDAIEKIDAIAQEKEALGTPICYPPPGATPQQLDEMENVLSNMRTNEQGYIVMPGPKAGQGATENTGWLVEILGYDRTGSGRDPQPSLNYHTQKIAAAFISEFMRLGHGQAGARATAQVQADPFLQSVEALAHIIEDTLNDQLVAPFIAYNLPECENPPRLQMSLVDSTSLSQLADYVLKLTQVGAMLPDQELEDFLRARADLPPANPESVKKRGKKDDDVRREIVTGGGPNGDAPGQNSRPGVPHGTKTSKPKSSSASKQMDAMGKRVRHRPLRPEEETCDLDSIEDYLDGLPNLFMHDDLYRIAKAAASNERSKKQWTDFRNHLQETLQLCYDEGMRTLRAELHGQGAVALAGSIRSRGLAGLDERCTHFLDAVESSVRLNAASARMNYGDDEARVHEAAENAGAVALKHAAWHHGTGAFMQGRHDAITLAQEVDPTIKVLYTAVLDGNTCEPCDFADDGQPRDLDDPVRLDRRPPNRHCASNASGHNYCRCMEIPVVR